MTELMEEELDGTSKKRSRNTDTEIKNTTINPLLDRVTAPSITSPSDTTVMEDVQLTEQQHNKANTKHFLSVESGSQACRTK
jgi:hypothetical protein